MILNTNNRSKFPRIIVLVLVLSAFGLSVFVTWRIDTAPRTDNAYVYADTINVSPEVSGRIIELAVKDNQTVKKGDVLFQIDPRPFKASLSKAQANLAVLNQEIELTQRSINSQKFAAAAATANIEHANATAKQATDTLNRMEPLFNKNFVSAEQIEQARTAKQAAIAQLATTKFDAQRATAAISDVDALVSQREVITAEIEMAKLNLEYTTVRAPFDGIVLNLKTSVGQFMASGHPVFTLINTTHWYVIANFRETDLDNIKLAQAAQVYVLSEPAKKFKGVVESIGYGVYPDDGGGETAGLPNVPRSINWVRVSQRFPVRILVDTPEPHLFRIGASAVAIMTPSAQLITH